MALAFFALPLIFIGFELVAFRSTLAQEEDAGRKSRLLSSLQMLKGRKALRGSQQKWFDDWIKNAGLATSPRRILAEMRRRGPSELDLSMAFLFLRPNGQVDEELSDFQVPEPLAPFLGKDLESLDRGHLDGFKARLPAYQDFFGPLIFRLEAQPAGIHRVGFTEKRRHLYISPPSKAGRILVFLDQPSDWDLREYQWDLSQYLAKASEEKGVVLHPGSKPDELRRILGPGFATGWRASLLLGPSTRQAIRVDDWLWAQVPIDRSSRLILGRPDTSRQELIRFRRNLFVLLLGVFSGSTVIFFWWMNDPESVHLRLPIRLFLLLAYVVGLPLLVYGLTARTLARDLHEVRHRQWNERQVSVLEELDHRKLDYIGFLESILMENISPGKFNGNPKALICRNLEAFNREFGPETILLVDRDGEKCFEAGANKNGLPPPLVPMVSRFCAKVMRKNAPTANPKNDDLAITLAEEQGINLELLSTIMTENPHRFTDLGLDTSNFSYILTPIGESKDHPIFLLLSIWFHFNLEQKYMDRFLPIFQARDPAISLAAQFQWGNKTVPASSPFHECSEEVWQEFQEARRPRDLSLALKTGDWHVTGSHGVRLRWVSIIAGSRASDRDAPEMRFHWRISLIALLLAFSGLLIARLLAEAFLGPIRDLSRGVEALAHRDFSHRIPPIDGAEFGLLAKAFNQTQEDLKDLELARILQERIYPSGTASLGYGWEIYAHCRPATEVGGDFYDFFPLEDGRWFMVIGDVSGHGSPAALIVAMAKGLFSYARKQSDPMLVLRDVQSVLARVLPRKKMMMTCLAGIFDPASGLIQFSNAGHNFPLLVDHQGAVREMKLLGMPLGVGKKRPEANRETMVEPGGSVFLFTDGLIEALDPQGRPIGFEAVQNALANIGSFGAREGVEQLQKWHDTQVAVGPQADDITLLLLKQRPGA
jgi:HAMP domain-containing protein